MFSIEVKFLPSVVSLPNQQCRSKMHRSCHRRNVHWYCTYWLFLKTWPIFFSHSYPLYKPLFFPLCHCKLFFSSSLLLGSVVGLSAGGRQEIFLFIYLFFGGRKGKKKWCYWIWQAVDGAAWQHMQVGLTALGGIRSRSSSSGISSSRYPSFSSWMFRSWLICCRSQRKRISAEPQVWFQWCWFKEYKTNAYPDWSHFIGRNRKQ